jgi:hypothetical protein
MGLKEELDILDTKISKLKVDYEQYFAKILKREPTALRDEIDRIILKYSTQSTTNTSLKFRYSTLTSKYTSYKQFWNRILRQIEEGTYSRGAFGAKLPEASVNANGVPQQRPEAAPPPPPRGAKEEALINLDKFKSIYQQLIEARKTCKESVEGMTYEKFTQALAQQTEKVKKDLQCKDIEYKVVVKDGKAKLTLIPVGKI